MIARTQQQTLESSDLGLIVVGLLSIGTSPALVEYAAASAVALAFWRCAAGALITAPAGFRTANLRSQVSRQWRWILLGGVALGAHFTAFMASLELTSTATAVTLASTTPLYVIGWRRLKGDVIGMRTIIGAVVAGLGVAILAGGDLRGGSIDGALLALAAAVTIAIYLLVGDHLRATLQTSSYVAGVYGVAALTMVPVAIVGSRSLVGFDRVTWLAIAGLVIGPQLGGHTIFNYLLGRIGSVLVSLVVLADPVVSSVISWVLLGETPPLVAWIGTPLVLAGLALAISRTAASPPVGSQ